MDSNKVQICKLFAILVLLVCFRSAGATNIDCGGKPFHCVNVTHFMICVDMGAGVSKTVDEFMIRCPPPTVCRVNNRFECEYHLPTTTKSIIRSDDKTNSFTIDTQETMTPSNKIINSINPLQKSTAKNLLNEYYYNTTDVTTQDYVPETQTNKQNESSEIPKILININKEALTGNEHSNILAVTSETYPTENLITKFPKMYFSNSSNDSQILMVPPNDEKFFRNDSLSLFSTKSQKVISEGLPDLSSDVTTINIINTTTLNDDYSTTKLIDTSIHDTTTETVSTDELFFENQELLKTNTLKKVLTTQTESSKIFTMFPDKIFPTTQTTNPMATDNSYFDNTSTNFASDNITKITKLVTQDENLLRSNNIELTSEYNLMERIRLDKTIDTLDTYELNISGTTERNFITNENTTNILFNTSYQLTNDIFTASNSPLQTTNAADTQSTIETTTDHNEYLIYSKRLPLPYENKLEMSPESGLTSTVLNPVTLKSKYPDFLMFEPEANEMTSTFDYQLPTEHLTETSIVHLTEKNIQQTVNNSDLTLLKVANTNDLLPKNDTLKVLIINNTITTENSYFVHPTSNTEYTTITPASNIGQEETSYLFNEHTNISEGTLLGDISTTYSSIPNLSANTTYSMASDDLTTLSPITTLNPTNKFIEQATDSNKTVIFIASKDVNMREIDSETTDGEEFSAMEKNMKFELDNHISRNKMITTISDINIFDHRIQEIVTENPRVATKTKDHTSPPIEENTMQMSSLTVTEYSYFDDIYLQTDNVTSKDGVDLSGQIMLETESNPSMEGKSEVTLNGEVPGTDANTRNLSLTMKFLLQNKNLTTLSSLVNLEQPVTTTKYLNDIKEATNKSTTLYGKLDSNPNILLQYKNVSETSTEFAASATLETTETLKRNTEKSAINKTPSMYYNENVIPKEENRIMTINEITTTESESKTIETFNSVPGLEWTPDGILKVTELPNNDLLANEMYLLHEQNTGSSLLHFILPSTDKPFISTNNTLELNLMVVDSTYDYDNKFEISTDMIKTFSNSKDNDNSWLQPKKLSESILPASVVELTTENIYHNDQITSDQSLTDTSKNIYATEVRRENVQELSNFKDEITTDLSTWKANHLPTQTVNLVESENERFQKNSIQMQSNINIDLPNNINNTIFPKNTEIVKSKLFNHIINTEIKQIFTVTKGADFTNTTNTTLLQFPNKTLIQEFETSASDQQKSVNSTEIPLEDALTSISSVTEETRAYNITDKFINWQSNAPLVIFSDSLKNNSIKNDNVMNKSNIANESDVDLSHTINNNSIVKNVDINNYNLSYNQLHTTKDRISNKRSVLTNSQNDIYNTSIKIDKANDFYINKFNNNLANIPFITKLPLTSTTTSMILDSTSNTNNVTPNINIFIKGTDGLNVENDRANNISKQQQQQHQNLSEMIHHMEKTSEQQPKNENTKNNTDINKANNTFKNDIPNTSVKYIELVTTESYQKSTVPVLLKYLEQPSFDEKLSETINKNYHGLKNVQENNNKFYTFESVNKDEQMLIKPNVSSTTNKIVTVKTNLAETESRNNTSKSMKNITSTVNLFTCKNRFRGRYADKNDCKKYYICIGLYQPILGACPANTVFSEIKKQCTKNLSHCIINHEFRCIQQGRFSDVLRSNIYYICVHHNNDYIRFKFQCQKGFNLNKTSVTCVSDMRSQSQTTSSVDNDSNKGSDQSTIAHKSKEKKQAKENTDKYICKQEGKFPYPEDCRRYYVCSKKSKSIFRRRTKKCDSDEVFHREKKKCVDRDSYECNE